MGGLQTGDAKEVLPLFESHFRLSILGIWQGDGNPQGIWPWGPAGFDYRPFRGLRQTETPVFKGTNEILHSARYRREEHFPHRKLKQNYLLLTGSWRALSGGVSWKGLTTGVGELENPPWCKPTWSSPLALLRPYGPPGLGHLRPKNHKGGSTTTPTSR